MSPLKILRRKAGLTQKRLAFLLGVTRQTIIRWEQGASQPSTLMVPKLAWALRITSEELLDSFVEVADVRAS